jgi:hypothetical protein
MNVVMGWKTIAKTSTHEANQAPLFGPFFHQEVLHKAKCGGDNFLHQIHTQTNGCS